MDEKINQTPPTTPDTDSIGTAIPDDIKTRREIATEKRRERIKTKFLELRAQYPTLRPSRIAECVAKTETRLADGVQTPQGVIAIIKKLGLWNGQRKYTKR